MKKLFNMAIAVYTIAALFVPASLNVALATGGEQGEEQKGVWLVSVVDDEDNSVGGVTVNAECLNGWEWSGDTDGDGKVAIKNPPVDELCFIEVPEPEGYVSVNPEVYFINGDGDVGYTDSGKLKFEFELTPMIEELQPIEAQALLEHSCDENEWHFLINQIDEEDNAPESIHVEWADGGSADVALDSFTGGVAHYYSYDHLDSTVVKATAEIYGKWSGKFNVSHGPDTCEPEPEEPETGDGVINVCKIVADQDGNISDGSENIGSFEIAWTKVTDHPTVDDSAGVPDTLNLETPLGLNADLVGDDDVDDAYCVSFTDLEYGDYFYVQEGVSGNNWLEPRYNDQYSVAVSDLSDFYVYSDELFTDDGGADDESRNQNADGHIVLSEERSERTLVILNTYELPDEPVYQCSDGLDNDKDGLTDEEDPGCWTNPKDPQSYDPTDDDEYNEIEEDHITLVSTKVVCDDESLLPNWAADLTPIDENTVSDFLSSVNTDGERCKVVEDYEFQWAPSCATNPGDNTGAADKPWTTFVGSTQILLSDLSESCDLWVREVWDEDYVPFTGVNDTEDVSAEMYCHLDTLNYDNLDQINDVEAGDTYHCVAFNALVEEPEEPQEVVEIVSNANVCLADELAFTASTTDGITSVLWDFGDGATSSATTTSHQYASEGNYTVTLTGYYGDDMSTSTSRVVSATDCSEPEEPPTTTSSGGGGGSRLTCEIDYEVNSDGSVDLTYESTGATEVTLTDDEGNVIFTTDDYLSSEKDEYLDYTVTVNPTRDTTYKLLAERGSRDRSCQVTVDIDQEVKSSAPSVCLVPAQPAWTWTAGVIGDNIVHLKHKYEANTDIVLLGEYHHYSGQLVRTHFVYPDEGRWVTVDWQNPNASERITMQNVSFFYGNDGWTTLWTPLGGLTAAYTDFTAVNINQCDDGSVKISLPYSWEDDN